MIVLKISTFRGINCLKKFDDINLKKKIFEKYKKRSGPGPVWPDREVGPVRFPDRGVSPGPGPDRFKNPCPEHL